jgi:hypothetical protein
MRWMIAFAAIFLGVTSGNAAVWTNGNQVVDNVIWSPNAHGFYVRSTTWHDPQGCGGTSNLYLISPALDEKTVDRLYAMLLTAHATGKTIYVWVDGCNTTVPVFSGLQINK